MLFEDLSVKRMFMYKVEEGNARRRFVCVKLAFPVVKEGSDLKFNALRMKDCELITIDPNCEVTAVSIEGSKIVPD